VTSNGVHFHFQLNIVRKLKYVSVTVLKFKLSTMHCVSAIIIYKSQTKLRALWKRTYSWLQTDRRP